MIYLINEDPPPISAVTSSGENIIRLFRFEKKNFPKKNAVVVKFIPHNILLYEIMFLRGFL